MSLGNIGQFLHIFQILTRDDLPAVQIEEHRSGSGNDLLDRNGLGLGRTVVSLGQQVLQACILSLLISELGIDSVNLTLRQSLEGVDIGSLVPCALTQVVGYTNLKIEVTVGRTNRGAIDIMICCSGCSDIVIRDVHAEFNIKQQLVGELQGVEQTDAVDMGIIVGRAVTHDTSSKIGNQVVATILIIATEQIGQVEEHLLLGIPILERVGLSILRDDVTSPDAIDLRAESNTRCEPFAHSQRQAKITTETFQRA